MVITVPLASSSLSYWDVDRVVVREGDVAAAITSAAHLARVARDRCGDVASDQWVPCVSLLLSNREGVTHGSVGIFNSMVTGVFQAGNGNCAGLTGALLLLADSEAGFDTLVAPDHVAVRSKRTGQVFELLEGGRPLLPLEVEARLKNAEVVRAEDFPAYYADNLAVRLAAAGDLVSAEQVFRLALNGAPSSRRVHFNFGTFLLDQGRNEEAVPHLEVAARGRKGIAEADLNRGVALSKLGRTPEAEKAFRRCLHRDPKNLMAQENLRRLTNRPASP